MNCMVAHSILCLLMEEVNGTEKVNDGLWVMWQGVVELGSVSGVRPRCPGPSSQTHLFLGVDRGAHVSPHRWFLMEVIYWCLEPLFPNDLQSNVLLKNTLMLLANCYPLRVDFIFGNTLNTFRDRSCE